MGGHPSTVTEHRDGMLITTQDSKRLRLYFVDIDNGVLYVYDPDSNKYGCAGFDKKVTTIALSQDEDSVGFCP